MSESTAIKLPQSVPFPVRISSILCSPGDNVPKHKTIFRYKYWDYQDDPRSTDEDSPKIRVERIGTFESPIEGDVLSINVKIHDEIAHDGVELCYIKEPCSHTVQYGGLCALCGKAIEDEKDYTGFNYEDRATIAMSHDNTGLKISIDEAAKIERNTTDRLVKDRKLILVVDLDQTVIHATVDPTVGEWQRDPSNPNYPSVKDVQSFCLEEEPMLPPGWTGPRPAPTKCWYYVKLRPGLKEFLQSIATLYELHIYTMATRSYALAIAKIIDPTGEYFGDRILSRDESGSLTHKNLKRLFPVDQSMVAIIDDRGDVWQWESNLIKVVPYDFFVGIGDINSSFLPKKNGQLTGPIKHRISAAKIEQPPVEEPAKDTQTSESSDASSPVDRILELGGGEGNTDLLIEQSITRSQSIEQQQHDRPLAKLQHNLDKYHHDQDHSSSAEDSVEEEEEENLLSDDDEELKSLQKVLNNIHTKYYSIIDSGKDNSNLKPDLTQIIPSMKSRCLEGVTILFSGIIPLGFNIENADIVIWCKQFGVKVVNEVYPGITHVVCREPTQSSGLTFKVRAAKKLNQDVKIVYVDWVFSCLSTWSKVDEKDYLINASPEDWRVDQKDLDKYQKVLESKSQNPQLQIDDYSLDSVKFEDYNLESANQEVDEFLAGISDDEDEDAGGEKVEGEDDENDSQYNGEADVEDDTRDDLDDSDSSVPYQPSFGSAADQIDNNHSSPDSDSTPIPLTHTSAPSVDSPPAYPPSRKRNAESDLGPDSATTKRQNTAANPLDEELEQELLNGFEDLEDS